MTRPRITVRGDDLPQPMKDYLAGLPKESRGNAASALGRLVEVADARGLDRCVNEQTVAALRAYYEAHRRSKESINGAIAQLRKYAEATGDGAEWARSSRKHRIGVTFDDLSPTMRQAIEDMTTGRQRRLGTQPPDKLRGIVTALRGLVEAADDAALPHVLNDDTVEAYLHALRARGVKPGSIEYYKSCLRTYAMYSREGVRWAEDSRGIDTRKMADVLAARHWDRWRPRAQRLMAQNVRQADIRLVDRFLALPRRSGLVSERDLRQLLNGSESQAQKLFWVLKQLCPRNPELHSLRRVLASMRPKSSGTRRGRKAAISVEPEDLPAGMRAKLTELRTARTKDGPRYAPETIDSMERPLRQLVFSARRRGLPEAITQETLSAWIDDLDARDLRPSSKKSYMHNLLLFAERAGIDDSILQLIAEDRAIYHSHGLGALKRKVERLYDHPVTIADVSAAAARWRHKARNGAASARDNTYRRLWFGSAILAILTVRPVRAKDLRSKLIVGVSVIREQDCWRFDFQSSKTDFEFDCNLPQALTPYLDDVILQGAECNSERDFGTLYNRRYGLPLFSDPSGRPFSHSWLYALCLEAFAHGPHATRMFMYERMALLGEAGKEVAKNNVGHFSDDSEAEYQAFATNTRFKAVDDVLALEIENIRRSA